MGQTDKRVKLENEMFTGMRAVKFYSWETALEEVLFLFYFVLFYLLLFFFFKVCNTVRNNELRLIKKLVLWRCALVCK